ncbi:hypothetical protein QVD17_30301 [Tagetes erecta]|uniref:Reverse transcriptase zinc-binding domain-containing protein n=1 Tax=Tagetes erecta TaxID=13708 RepID=A0AAD8NFW6_TARER|nr:hypothetical protein QVD17_30301 [Tagetes erecta]
MQGNVLVWIWRWRHELLLSHEQDQMDDLIRRLISVSPTDSEAAWQWGEIAGQKFSASYTKQMIHHSKPAVEGRLRWNNWVSKTVNVFNWRVLHNRIPTCDSLSRRNISIQSTLCKFCGLVEESVEHLFISYGLTMEAVHAAFMATTWALWKHRNDIVFEGAQPLALKVICDVRVTTSLWLTTRSSHRAIGVLNNFPFHPD